MKHMTKKTLAFLLTAALSFCLMASVAMALTVNMTASETVLAMPDGELVTMWGYAIDGDVTYGVPFGPNGPPVIRATTADSLTISLTNSLPITNPALVSGTSVIIPGQNDTTMTPVFFIDGQGRSRAQSLTHETASGASGTLYTWNSLKAGTYLIQSGSHPGVQVPMGLYAVLIVDVATGTTAYTAQPDAIDINYSQDVVLLYSEVDSLQHLAITNGDYGTPTYPTTMAAGYGPDYFLINGHPYAPGDEPLTAGTVGSTTMVRFLNAGLEAREPLIQNGYFTVVAEDGNPFTSLAPGTLQQYSQYTLDLAPGKTLDALFTTAVEGYFPIYDRRLGLVNKMTGGGGLLAYLKVDPASPVTQVLTVAIDGASTGTGIIQAASAPGGIDSSVGDLTETYLAGTEITLRATADPGSALNGWLVTDSVGPTAECQADPFGDCVVTMDDDKTVTATFNSATPLNNTTEFVKQVYRDFLNREADQAGLDYWVNGIDAGLLTRAECVESFLLSAEFGGNVSPVTRLYFSYFLRIPDYDGLIYWISQYGAGMSLTDISEFFVQSAEFIATYGSLTNAEFVNLVYLNVLERTPDQAGLDYWVGLLDAGSLTRGEVMTGFSESAEYKATSASEIYVTMTYIGLLRRSPDQTGFDFWVATLDSGGSGLGLIDGFLVSAEYAARF